MSTIKTIIYSIYRILFPNGKSYIGFTSKTLEERKREHLSTAFHRKRSWLVHDAIRKYGDVTLSWELLYESTDADFCLDIMEPYCIKLYRSHVSEHGYNMTWGGDAPGLNKPQSKDTRLKRGASLREYHKIHGSPNKGRRYIKKPNSGLLVTGERNPFYGHKHSIKTKILMSMKARGIPKPKVSCLICHIISDNSNIGKHYKKYHSGF